MIRHTLAAIAVLAAAIAAAPAQAQTVLTYTGTIGDSTRMGTQTFTIAAGNKPDSYLVQGKVDLDYAPANLRTPEALALPVEPR